jgi:hypothetical protein
MSSLGELRIRCESDNPLEVYYDVIDALYSAADAGMDGVLACLQIGPS